MSEPRVYASGVGGRIAALVGGLVAVPLVAIGVPAIGLREFLNIRDSKLLIAVCVGLLVVGGVWLLVHVFVTGPIRVETDATTVRLRRGPRVTNEWSRAGTVFSSLVVRNTTNGIPSGANRTLMVATPGERVDVACRWFSTATFNDMMADLAPVSDWEAPDAPAASARDFVLNPRAGALRGPRLTAVVVLIVVVLLAVGAVAVLLATDPTADMIALPVLASVALFVIVVMAAAYGIRRRAAARIPTRISVTGSTIQVGERTLYFGQIERIELTPPSYSGNARTMTLVEKIGPRTTYRLGSGVATGASVFPEYGEFVALLGRTTPAGVVRLDHS